MRQRPATVAEVLTGVDWDRWSVILLKPDCVRRGLVDTVLERISDVVSVRGRMDVSVADWQIHVHYWDLLVGADWFECDIPDCLREMYVGRQVTIALAHGPAGTPSLVRDLLGHFDPAQATKGTLRGDLGTDSLVAARADGRLVENLIHSSDDAAAACRDFGTWYGANRHHLLGP
ncbi:nucleoside-diphosphate kinase [Streptomyces sp. NPDC058614]|uniref:nucleoside-diphosphate kinase n=1 Tax=Streptomyces sp. NPDC058614 TaxID=3346557 RepID=UPI0036466138